MPKDVLNFCINCITSLHLQCRRFTPPFLSLTDFDLGLRRSIAKLPEALPPLGESGLIEPNSIYHLTDRFGCNYALLSLPESKEYMLVGPMLTREMTDARFYPLMETLGLPQDFYPQMRHYYNALPPTQNTTTAFTLINQLGEALYGVENLEVYSLSSHQMEVWEGFFNGLELQVPKDASLSMQVLEARYAGENKLLEYVHNGNTAAAVLLAGGKLNLLADRLTDSLRNTKYLLVTLNTLMRKEAEHASVHPLHIDRLSNSIVVKIDHLASPTESEELVRKMVRSYCELVRLHSLRGFSQQVQKIITTIEADLAADLSLKRFAAELNVNASYLSTLFKNDTGLSLTDYVNKQRIARAKKLLKSTGATTQTIACAVGIPDVHYFGRLFRREAGTTPKEYRRAAAPPTGKSNG